MKLTLEEIRKKHSIGIENVFKFIQGNSNFDPFLTESEKFLDIKFDRLCGEYSNYERRADDEYFHRKKYSKKSLNECKRIIEKYTKKQYVEDRINKYIALDHLYHGDILFKYPDWGHISIKVSNSRFLRRYPISRFKGQYIILYNNDDVSKSRVIKRTHVKSYFSSICNEEKWKKMPSKKRNSVFQCMDKFENFCTLGEFCTIHLQQQLTGLDFQSIEQSFFIKRKGKK